MFRTEFPNTPEFAALKQRPACRDFTATEMYDAQWDLAVELGLNTRDEMMDDYGLLPFTFVCGTYEQHDGEMVEDCKLSESYVCLEDAIAAKEKYRHGCAYARIEFRNGDFVYEIDPVRTHRLREHDDGVKRYDPCDFDGTFFNVD